MRFSKISKKIFYEMIDNSDYIINHSDSGTIVEWEKSYLNGFLDAAVLAGMISAKERTNIIKKLFSTKEEKKWLL